MLAKDMLFLQEIKKKKSTEKKSLLHCRLWCCRVVPEAAPESVSTRMPQTSTVASCLAQIRLERDFANTVVQQSGVNTSLILFWRMCRQKWKEEKCLSSTKKGLVNYLPGKHVYAI